MRPRPSEDTLPPTTHASLSDYCVPGAFVSSDNALRTNTSAGGDTLTRRSRISAASGNSSNPDIGSLTLTAIPYTLAAGLTSTILGLTQGAQDWYSGTAGTQQAEKSSGWSRRSMLSGLRSLGRPSTALTRTTAPPSDPASSAAYDFSTYQDSVAAGTAATLRVMGAMYHSVAGCWTGQSSESSLEWHQRISTWCNRKKEAILPDRRLDPQTQTSKWPWVSHPATNPTTVAQKTGLLRHFRSRI